MIQRIGKVEDWQKLVDELRQHQGSSIQQVAELSGMTNPTLYKLLRKDGANPTLRTMLKVGNCLGYTLMATQCPTYYERGQI